MHLPSSHTLFQPPLDTPAMYSPLGAPGSPPTGRPTPKALLIHVLHPENLKAGF